jgi:hypothetical protein
MLYGLNMSRAFLLGLVVLTAACGGNKTPQQDSVCGSPVPPPACTTACDPAAGAPTTCPAGFHCASSHKCDSLCAANSNDCGDGYECTSDGFCISKGNGDDPGTEPDAFCPTVQFTAKATIPSIQLLIDRSGSMAMDFNGNKPDTNSMDPAKQEKFSTEVTALVGSAGVVTQLASQVYFGASMYPGATCTGSMFSVGRALNNEKAISDLLAANGPGGNTPTAPSIAAVVQDFTTNKPPVGSPPVIVLATDGLPNRCGSQTDNDPIAQQATIDAAAAAYSKGIPLFLLSVGTIDPVFEQKVANAGAGAPPGTNAKAFKATNSDELAAAFQEIIRGVVSCDLNLNGMVKAEAASTGVIVLNGTTLTYLTDWTLDASGTVIHLLGTACTALKSSANPKIDATFACGGGTIFF